MNRIRTASIADIEAVLEVERQSFLSPWPREAFVSEFETPEWSRVVVTECENTITGFMIYGVVADEMHLTNIAVMPNWRGRGLGSTLLEHLIAKGKAEGRRYVFLEVRESNRVAFDLYKAYDFEELDRRKGYYEDNGEDALVMILRLDQQPSRRRSNP